MKLFRKLSIGCLTVSLLFGAAAAAHAAVYNADGRPLSETIDVAGSGLYNEIDGTAGEASFRHPSSLAFLPDGSLLVSDTGNHRIRSIKGGAVSVYAGTEVSVLLDESGLPAGGFGDGSSDVSFFSSPSGIDSDAAGNVYVADRDNHAVRKIAKDGTVTTIAGNGVLGFQDGVGQAASFYAPTDVAVAADGTVYVADTLNHAIRKISPNGTVTTLSAESQRVVEMFSGVVVDAGDFADGELGGALFNEPSGLALDAKGNLYVSDTGNQRIRYIDFAAGTVATVAGGGEYEQDALYVEGFNVDGAAADARFYSPKGLALDSDGGLYIADSLNHSIRYLKDGKVMTVVGNSEGEYGAVNGYESDALLDFPSDVAIAADGSLFVADTYNNKIRKIAWFELPADWQANGNIRVWFDGGEIVFDALPENRSNRTMVPVRKIAEALGYDVSFEGNNILLTGDRGDIMLTVGGLDVSRTADGKTETQPIDAAPYIHEERTYVPVRFFAENIGLHVAWDAATMTVIIRK